LQQIVFWTILHDGRDAALAGRAPPSSRTTGRALSRQVRSGRSKRIGSLSCLILVVLQNTGGRAFPHQGLAAPILLTTVRLKRIHVPLPFPLPLPLLSPSPPSFLHPGARTLRARKICALSSPLGGPRRRGEGPLVFQLFLPAPGMPADRRSSTYYSSPSSIHFSPPITPVPASALACAFTRVRGRLPALQGTREPLTARAAESRAPH